MGQITVLLKAYRDGAITRPELIEHLQGFEFRTPARFATMPDDVFEADAQAEERTYDDEDTADELYRARATGLLSLDDLLAITEALESGSGDIERDRHGTELHDGRMLRTPTGGRKCPSCGAPGIRIVYGMPGAELFEAADRGEVVLGGCVIGGDDPDLACPQGHRWRRRSKV